jgi:hypothetical protein
MDEAISSMIIHLGKSSDETSTDDRELWSSSEDEWIGEMAQISVCFLFKLHFSNRLFLYTFMNVVL